MYVLLLNMDWLLKPDNHILNLLQHDYCLIIPDLYMINTCAQMQLLPPFLLFLIYPFSVMQWYFIICCRQWIPNLCRRVKNKWRHCSRSMLLSVQFCHHLICLWFRCYRRGSLPRHEPSLDKLYILCFRIKGPFF